MNKSQKYAPWILRLGIAFVFAWFGTSQLLNPAQWSSLIPHWIVSLTGISAGTFVILNGIFEIVASVLLAVNVCVRVFAFLLFLHLFSIVLDVGLTSIGIRDIGLAIATLVISMQATKNNPALQTTIE